MVIYRNPQYVVSQNRYLNECSNSSIVRVKGRLWPSKLNLTKFQMPELKFCFLIKLKNYECYLQTGPHTRILD